jgi:lipoprotein-anchoring transpeptidase ErfK/SrfK
VRDVLEAQIALERQRISSGSIDGVMGPQTRAAIRVFQRKTNLPETGELDVETKARLTLAAPAFGACTIRSNDLARLQQLGKTWLEKSQQSALEFESILELMAEQGHSHPALLRAMNRGVDWTHVSAGMSLEVPVVTVTEPAAKAAFVTISLGQKNLEVFDAQTNLMGHFPCSIAQRVEKRPVGELHVSVMAPNPNYTFDPELFPESEEARQSNTKLVIPPGPNNPVGTVWIGLDKPGYGVHGTSNPESVGRTESHGCFRLANWNAELLLELVWIGMPVYVEP